MHRHGTFDAARTRLGQPEMPHLAGGHEFRHRPDGVLDRNVRVDAVLVVEVDVVDAEPAQRRVAGLADILRTAVDPLSVAVPPERELRREHDLVAATADGLADELLVVPETVDI